MFCLTALNSQLYMCGIYYALIKQQKYAEVKAILQM